MTASYHGDCCPGCGSYEVTPYAVILGAAEEYGYHCAACGLTWPVLTYPADTKVAVPRRGRSRR